MSGARFVVTLLLCALVNRAGMADEVVLTSNKALRGFARRAGAFVDVNTYNCSAPEMTFGVERLRELDVREIRPWPMGDHLHGRLLELGTANVEERRELLRLADAFKEEALGRRLAEEILLRVPEDARALKRVGGAARFEARRQELRLEQPELKRQLSRVVALPSAKERSAAATLLERQRQISLPADGIERMALARGLPRGVQLDRSLRLLRPEYDEGRYCLYVPEDLDPLEPAPLLIALHGGGIREAEKGTVRGRGQDALAWFQEGAREHGFLLVCPTALEAPWTTPRNENWVGAVLADICAFYNVDLERVHLAGQGGGGDGAWWMGARDARTFASVAVASAQGPDRLSALLSAELGLWIYHGEDDEQVAVAEIRKAAESLRKQQADFVYCELPREGQGFPPAARRDYWRYVAPKRRAKAASAWPQASLLQDPSSAFLQQWGEPRSAWGLSLPGDLSPEELLLVLGRGGFEAEPAARKLATLRALDAALRLRLREWVRDSAAPPATRRWSTWLLGAVRDDQAGPVLADLLRAEQDLELLVAAAGAAAGLAEPEALHDLRYCLSNLAVRYKAVAGTTVPLRVLEGACRLGAALAEGLARVGARDTETLGALEEALVIGVLRDPRPVMGGTPADELALRAMLSGAIARTYRSLGAEKTLLDMLRLVVRRQPELLAAVEAGAREGWR